MVVITFFVFGGSDGNSYIHVCTFIYHVHFGYMALTALILRVQVSSGINVINAIRPSHPWYNYYIHVHVHVHGFSEIRTVHLVTVSTSEVQQNTPRTYMYSCIECALDRTGMELSINEMMTFVFVPLHTWQCLRWFIACVQIFMLIDKKCVYTSVAQSCIQ